jgi:hypothetical protein
LFQTHIISDNKICSINGDKNYYENVYNYLASFNANTINGKTKWKNILYPDDLFKKEDKKTLKDKRRRAFRNKCSNYILINNKLYYKKQLKLIDYNFTSNDDITNI